MADVAPPDCLWISGMAFESRIAMAAAGVPASATLHGLRADALSDALSEALSDATSHALPQTRRQRHDPGHEAPLTLISFGLAGGLAPGLPAGSIVIADTVLTDRTRYATDPAWRAALRRALPHAVTGAVRADDKPVLDVSTKRQCHLATGALAADMESHRVARAANARGWPLVVCRVVADPAGRTVPQAALAAMGPTGNIAFGALLQGLLSRPTQLAGLLALARDTAVARRALREAAQALECGRRGAAAGAITAW